MTSYIVNCNKFFAPTKVIKDECSVRTKDSVFHYIFKVYRKSFADYYLIIHGQII